MRAQLDFLLTLPLPALILLHLVLSPYTKVEESFNLQATHDILTYGIPTRNVTDYLFRYYDHFSFPGVVPRTFTGAVVLAAMAKPGVWLGINAQLAVRGALGLLNALALLSYRNAVSTAFGRSTGNWYLLFQASQFHVVYYASRTLPNMFAFALTTLALRGFLPDPTSGPSAISRRHRLSVYLLTLTGVVFRSEVALLLVTHLVFLLYTRRISLFAEVLPAGFGGAAVGLLVTVPLDSFFWQRIPLWPELAGFFYNAVAGKSSDWGTSPWWFYVGSALPRLLLNPLAWMLCLPLALTLMSTRRAAGAISIPLLGFVAAYSIQPHKEWRFIVYAVPGLTATCALGANYIWTRRAKSALYGGLSTLLLLSVVGSLAASTGMLLISRLNYPGAEAVARVHEIALSSVPSPHARSTNVTNADDSTVATIVHTNIHMDTLSCTTGVTRFLELKHPIVMSPSSNIDGSVTPLTAMAFFYDKTENETTLLRPEFWERFDYVIAERPEKVIGKWEIVESVKGFAGVKMSRKAREDDREAQGGKDTRFEVVNGEKKGMGGSGVAAEIGRIWHLAEKWARRHITGGRWVEIRMEDRVHILARSP
ncbi:MAG: dolichyl-P-Man:Man(7)GlcNAc(2)-PP-dolichol alpha-1,6-mannosyltransferase [Caeruleum heppii]|nr:MAG: dolichyl-P-Man:Man(7)GlcNAc(2)-PP-dolichol alpha-1,6-mannosyltransferase [Caeruleum heppii]